MVDGELAYSNRFSATPFILCFFSGLQVLGKTPLEKYGTKVASDSMFMRSSTTGNRLPLLPENTGSNTCYNYLMRILDLPLFIHQLKN